MCKSFFGLASISSLRPQRILTELYARLIGVVLTYFRIAPLRLPYENSRNREISPVKVRQIFQRFARFLLLALDNPARFLSCLQDFLRHVLHSGFKQKRKKSPNLLHALSLLSACYGWLDADDLSFNDFLPELSLSISLA